MTRLSEYLSRVMLSTCLDGEHHGNRARPRDVLRRLLANTGRRADGDLTAPPMWCGVAGLGADGQEGTLELFLVQKCVFIKARG